MARRFAQRQCGFLLICLLLAQTGCAGKNLLDWKREKTPVADERNPVRKMVCIWEPKQGQGLDGLPCRGFAGNIMFFTNSSPKPATSAGDVRVYLFHDRGTPEEQAKPIHQFDFKGKAWATHLSDSVPGPSYRIFIPYTDRQPYQVTCGLRVRLTPPGGQPVYSEMVHVRLPGPAEQNTEEESDTLQQPQLTRRSTDVSDFQLGATLHRHRGPTFGETALEPRSLNLKPASGSSQTIPTRDSLQQLLQEAVAESQAEVVRGSAPTEPERSRRFKMSPTATCSQQRDCVSQMSQEAFPAESTPIQNDTPQIAHPLEKTN